MDCFSLRLKIEPKEIVFLSSIIEAYPGFATVRTENPALGIVTLLVSPSFYKEVKEIIIELQKIITLHILSESLEEEVD